MQQKSKRKKGGRRIWRERTEFERCKRDREAEICWERRE